MFLVFCAVCVVRACYLVGVRVCLFFVVELWLEGVMVEARGTPLGLACNCVGNDFDGFNAINHDCAHEGIFYHV